MRKDRCSGNQGDSSAWGMNRLKHLKTGVKENTGVEEGVKWMRLMLWTEQNYLACESCLRLAGEGAEERGGICEEVKLEQLKRKLLKKKGARQVWNQDIPECEKEQVSGNKECGGGGKVVGQGMGQGMGSCVE